MRRGLLGVVMACLACFGVAQPTGAAVPPSIEMLWQVLGSVSAIELNIAGTNVQTVHLAVMFQGDVLLEDTIEVDPADGHVLTVNAGTLNSGLVAWCEEAYAVLWSRYVQPSGRANVSGLEACVGGSGTNRVLDFPSEPFGIPKRVYGLDIALPMERWLLFGTTFVDLEEDAQMRFEGTITYYVYLSAERAPPFGSRPLPPSYESIREAESAFDAP